ncbi:MAG TPA: hypothetical protein VHL98_06515 [Microvirga sp.]|nr:hypothetical protein [Microvirga sp.]
MLRLTGPERAPAEDRQAAIVALPRGCDVMPALSTPCRDAARLSGGRRDRVSTRETKTVTTARRPLRGLTRKTKTVTTAETAD